MYICIESNFCYISVVLSGGSFGSCDAYQNSLKNSQSQPSTGAFSYAPKWPLMRDHKNDDSERVSRGTFQGVESTARPDPEYSQKSENHTCSLFPTPHPSLNLISSVQLLSCVRLFATPWIPARQASLSITNSRSSPRLTSIESVMPSSHISSSVFPFSSCPQSLPASESFPVSQLFTWGAQSTAVSALASFLPKKSQGWSPSVGVFWVFWLKRQTVRQSIGS